MIKATFTFNELPQNIQAETALKLFGKNLNLSVSKIEQYYQDPYSHFLLHGLKLQERQLFELNPAKTGDYFHDFLDFGIILLIRKIVLGRVVCIVVKTYAFFTFACHFDNKVTVGDKISKFA